jgi:hypothetical protein
MKVKQPIGTAGSLMWIQRAVNQRPKMIEKQILSSIPGATGIEWLSPLANDDYAEYRDSDFLHRIGQGHVADRLATFWPERGPQWDALGRTDTGEVILVEAKAHIDEMFSAGCQASERSFKRISETLDRTITAYRAKPAISWTGPLYQMANRLAHLHFLATAGVPARLVFVCFVGDKAMNGPESAAEWKGALRVARKMLGLPSRGRLLDRVIESFPHISELQLSTTDVVIGELPNSDTVGCESDSNDGVPISPPIDDIQGQPAGC